MSQQEKKKIQNREWRIKNSAKIKEYKAKYHSENKDEISQKQKIYREKNRDVLIAYSRKRYDENREMMNTRARKYKKENREKVKSYRKEYRIDNRAKIMVYTCKRAAMQKGILYDLTPEWVLERLAAGICELSGMDFDMEGSRTPNSPSVDRIIPGGDYTQDNCRIILWSVNRALNNYGQEYIFEVFRKILERRDTDG